VSLIKNLLITGKPGSGKTTLILQTIKRLNTKAYGFYTKEIRESNIRVGFELCTLKGEKGLLAHKDIESRFRVGKYKVCLEFLEEVGVKAIEEGIENKGIIVIDEIGKMELFSKKFKQIVFKALDSKSKVLATIMEKSHIVADKIKNRPDIKLLRVEEVNDTKLVKLLT
jgi:nucleoside-triphosphatase